MFLETELVQTRCSPSGAVTDVAPTNQGCAFTLVVSQSIEDNYPWTIRLFACVGNIYYWVGDVAIAPANPYPSRVAAYGQLPGVKNWAAKVIGDPAGQIPLMVGLSCQDIAPASFQPIITVAP